MNQLENSLPKKTNIDFEQQSNQPLLCPQHGETIEVLIIDEKIKTSQTRSGCGKCINNQSYRLISLTQAKNDHLPSFQKVYSEIKNKLRTVENIDKQLNYIEKNHKNILNTLEIITKIFSQIINNFHKGKQQINQEMQFNSVSELEIFAEYIAQSKFDEQQKICKNYINKFHKNMEEELKEELNQLNIQIQSIINIAYSVKKNNQIYTLDQEESIKSVNKIGDTAYNNQKSSDAIGVIKRKCLKHNLQLFQNQNTSISEDKKQVHCDLCSDEERGKLIEFDDAVQYQKSFTEVSEKIMFQESAFIQMLQKNLKPVIDRYQEFCDFFKDFEIQFDNILQTLYFRISQQKNQISQFLDKISKMDLSEEQVEIFYQEEEEITDQFNLEILSEHNSKMECLSNQLFLQFSKILDALQQDFNLIQGLLGFKLNFLQISKAFVGQFKCMENQYIQFTINDKQLNCLQDNKDLVQYSLKVLKSNQQFINDKPRQCLKREQIKNFIISQDSSWFVTASYKQSEIEEIQFWLKNGASYESFNPIEVSPIEQLEIDSIHDACFSFHINKFLVWRKNNKFEMPQTIFLENFIKATFNQNYTLLVVQQYQNGILDIYQQINSNLQSFEKIQVPLANIHYSKKFTVWLLEKPNIVGSQFLITFQEGLLLIHLIDLIKKESKLKQTINLEKGKIVFCQNQNIFALLKKYESIVSLYAIKLSDAEKFHISKFSMIFEFEKCIKVQFSQSGKFISIRSGNNQTLIYCVQKLPRLYEIYLGLESQKKQE